MVTWIWIGGADRPHRRPHRRLAGEARDDARARARATPPRSGATCASPSPRPSPRSRGDRPHPARDRGRGADRHGPAARARPQGRRHAGGRARRARGAPRRPSTARSATPSSTTRPASSSDGDWRIAGPHAARRGRRAAQTAGSVARAGRVATLSRRMVNTILSVLQVPIAAGVIFLVLLHSGKDAGMSGAFGVGVGGRLVRRLADGAQPGPLDHRLRRALRGEHDRDPQDLSVRAVPARPGARARVPLSRRSFYRRASRTGRGDWTR